MKSVESSDLLPYIKSYFLIHNLLQEKEPYKVFQIHTFHAVPSRKLLFPLNYFCSMPPLSGSSSFPYLPHINKTWLFLILLQQKSFHHNIPKAGLKIKCILRKLSEYPNFLSWGFIQFFTFVDLTGIFIINYKNYINIIS